MKNIIFISLLSFILVSSLYPAKLHTFSDISKPRMISVDKRFVYISEINTHSVLVYDLNNFKLIKKIGQKGEGPKEFKIPPFIHFTSDKIFISGYTKILVYSKTINFLKEIRPVIWAPGVFPVQDYFASNQSKAIDNRNYTVLTLFNEKFETIKEIPISPESTNEYLFFTTTFSRSWKDRIYVNHPKERFHIEVFSKFGEKLYTIEKKLDRIEANEKHRHRFIDFALNSLGKKLFSKFKASKRFDKPLPKFLPDIKNFYVVDDKIYVKTFDVDRDKDKYIILNIEGKILETKYLPKAFYKKFTFSDNKFYYLVDNEDEENWELHVVEL